MLAFATAFAAALLLGTGARDQVLVAALAQRLGRRLSLLLVALSASALAAALAVWAGTALAAQVPAPWQALLAALTAFLAALEMAVMRPGPIPQEPTRSLGAMALAFTLVQLPDAVRIVLFGLALAGALPHAAMPGAILGALATVWTGWSLGARLPLHALRRWRVVAALLLGLAGTLAPILR